MNTLSRREALFGGGALLALTALPHTALAKEQNAIREKLHLPAFKTYKNPLFGRREHEAFHAELEAEYSFAEGNDLKRWNSNPNRVYVNEKAGESIRITGVNPTKDYVEMIWVLAPAYSGANGEMITAHVPFEHVHSNQAEEFKKISGAVTARVNGVILEGDETDFFTAEPKDDHIAWNPEQKPLAMRVRYRPGFGRDGERALMVYWGFVDNASRTGDEGQPKNFPLLGALNGHLSPQALASNMPNFLPALVRPFLVNPINRGYVNTLYRELTGEDHPACL